MNILALVTLSLLSSTAFASNFILQGSSPNRLNEISTGLIDFKSPAFRFVSPDRDSSEFFSSFYSRESLSLAKNSGDVENCENKSTIRGFRQYLHWTCFNKELFNQAQKNYNDTTIYSRDLQTQISLNGFTPSMAELYVSVTTTGTLVSQASNTGSSVTHMGTSRIVSCIDRQGKTHHLRERDVDINRSNIESLIDELLDSGYEKYVRCVLYGSALTATSLTTISTNNISMSPRRVYLLEISDLSDDIVINSSFVYRGNPTSDDSDVTIESLNEAIENYVDFIKFEYGLVLADIAKDQLTEAQARLKVNRFLSENRSQIRELLSTLEKALEKSPLFTKIAAGFRVAQVYGMIKQIESSLNTQLTLDRIIRR